MTTETRFHVLHNLERQLITEDEACKALNCTKRTLHQVQTIWKPHLSHLIPLLDQLRQPATTKNDQKLIKEGLASVIGTSYRQVNRLLKEHEFTLPKAKTTEIRVEKRVTAQNRRRTREKHALDVIAGLTSVEHAAEAAEVTERQIYRLVGKLCDSAGTHFKDVKHLTQAKRKTLANQIEKTLDDL